MNVETRICELFYQITMRFAAEFGAPLPKRILSIGDAEVGWGVRLNPTNADLEGVPRFSALVTWGGLPAGLLDPGGGTMVVGEAANQETFREWLAVDA